MDWTRAIERNRAALLPIVAGLFAMLGLRGGDTPTRIPHQLHRAMLALLRPVEAAVRRLVVIAARGLVVKVPAARPWPAGKLIGKGQTSRAAFQLYDPRKRFTAPVPGKGPHLTVITGDPRLVARWSAAAAPIKQSSSFDAAPICNRLQALKRALDDLPGQTKRLARWRQRRAVQASPKFTSPLRPGPPPGQRRKPVHDIDWILGECHALAFDVLRTDSS